MLPKHEKVFQLILRSLTDFEGLSKPLRDVAEMMMGTSIGQEERQSSSPQTGRMLGDGQEVDEEVYPVDGGSEA